MLECRPMRPLLFLSLFVVAFSGCPRGPKGSPGGSVKSFYRSVVAEDWESMADTVSAQSMKKFGTRQRALTTFANNYAGWKDADITIEEEMIDTDGTGATVRFTCVETQLVKYKATQFDCSDTYLLALEEDGKWHIHLPGATRLNPMQ